MIKIALLLLMAAQAYGTTVSTVMSLPNGDLVNGSCTYKISTITSLSNAMVVAPVGVVIPFGQPSLPRGELTVTLVPTDTMWPPTVKHYYSVQCTAPAQVVNSHMTQASNWSWIWQVPTSLTTLSIDQVLVSNPGDPSVPSLNANLPIRFNIRTGLIDYDVTANLTPTGYWDFTGARWKPPTVRFSLPPTSMVVDETYRFTDALGKGLCTGGGTSTTDCFWNGTAWESTGLRVQDLTGLYEPVDVTILRRADFAGSGSSLTVAHSDHNHAGTYEPVDTTLIRQADLFGSGSSLRPARSDHTHAGVYETSSTNGASLAPGTYCMNVNGSNVKTWIACPTSGGGGGGGVTLSWSSLSNSDWAAMSNTQWTTMTN